MSEGDLNKPQLYQKLFPLQKLKLYVWIAINMNSSLPDSILNKIMQPNDILQLDSILNSECAKVDQQIVVIQELYPGLLANVDLQLSGDIHAKLLMLKLARLKGQGLR